MKMFQSNGQRKFVTSKCGLTFAKYFLGEIKIEKNKLWGAESSLCILKKKEDRWKRGKSFGLNKAVH